DQQQRNHARCPDHPVSSSVGSLSADPSVGPQSSASAAPRHRGWAASRRGGRRGTLRARGLKGAGAMHFVIHAVDKPGIIETRAKLSRPHRQHLDESRKHGVEIFTAGSLVDEDGETPVGSLFVVEAKDRAAVDAFTRSDPYHVHRVWDRVDVHYYRKKR